MLYSKTVPSLKKLPISYRRVRLVCRPSKHIPFEASGLFVLMANPQVSRFCWQNLQVDPTPVFPDADLIRDEAVQEVIYERVFSDQAPFRPPLRYRVRILKELMAKIESAIHDWDQHVSGAPCDHSCLEWDR
jgi:hypothetical protein